MILTLPKPLSKKTIPWKHREHLFTPENITKLESISAKERVVRRIYMKIIPKPLPNGPIKHLMNKGVYLCFMAEEEFYEQSGEAALILLGPQLPEDRSGEPKEFYL